MNKADLLEKTQQSLFKIMEILYLSDGSVSKQTLAQKLDLSPATLKRYLDDLQVDVQPLIDEKKITFCIGANTAEFKLIQNFALDDWIFRLYLKDAPKFQILMYIYKHGSMDSYQLQDDLNMSEASLYRVIKQLNKLLKEFELTIHNGHLQGSGLQVRFFYYILFQLTNYFPPKKSFAIDKFVDGLQSELHFYFHSEAVHRVDSWLIISQQRLGSQSVMDSEIPKRVRELYQKNELYQQVSKCYKQAFHMRSATKEQFEIEAFCVMLISMSVFNSKTNVARRFYDIYNSQKTQLADLVEKMNHTITSTLKISRHQWPFELMKLVFDICARPFCFTGDLAHMDEIYSEYYMTHFFSQEARLVVKELMQIFKKEPSTPFSQFIKQNENYFQRRLLFVIRDFRYQQIKDIDIGVDTTFDYYISQMVIDQVRQIFKKDIRVNVTYYQPGNAYDLVLTNYHEEPYDDTDYTYWLTNLGTIHDLEMIKKIVEKNFYAETPVHHLMLKQPNKLHNTKKW
ncbi:Trans-acting positive regulator [Pediococcus damnosus]|uniref:helix-turn-helix domain-containing protein n=1 Tax=Pediococcus damnosus TaxID=51663 RepID=UPI00078D33F9|nr:helix-turn-helix domain-containing protein [Pediococcus damnosus]AMV60208.1 Trans-acting positive regulator [Pediococcus damnosus]AMV64458.1 Trans-acting positive regulator [Pediococcus damnosus]